MKPRISYWRKTWGCRAPDFLRTGIIGVGYSPIEAFEEWRRLGGASC